MFPSAFLFDPICGPLGGQALPKHARRDVFGPSAVGSAPRADRGYASKCQMETPCNVPSICKIQIDTPTYLSLYCRTVYSCSMSHSSFRGISCLSRYKKPVDVFRKTITY